MELINCRDIYRMSIDSAKGAHKDRMLVMANRSLTKRAATLVALLIVTNKEEKGAEVAKSAKELLDDADYHRALDEALKGKFPMAMR